MVFRTKLHATVLMFPNLALAITVALFGVGGIGHLVIILAAGWLAVELANHGMSELGVTNKRVLMKRGYLPRKLVERHLTQVAEVQVTQSALGKKLGYGAVIGRGTDGSRTAFAALNQPVAVLERMQARL